MLEASFFDLSALNLSERSAQDATVSVWPAWQVRDPGGTLSWFHVRLAFPDGAGVDALAVVREGHVSIEDVRAEPALSLADLTALARWIKGPLFASCGVAGEGVAEDAAQGAYEDVQGGAGRPDEGGPDEAEAGPDEAGPEAAAEEVERGPCEQPGFCAGPGRARSAWPRGIEGCRQVAREYRAAQEQGADPVLAVMSATGRSRRRSLRLIAQARDAGFLTARHVRRE